MKLLPAALATLLTAFAATTAIAGPTCTAPQEKWMKVPDFKARLEAEGYRIKTFKITPGNCYEIYGFNKAGKKVEIYFDPQTAAVLLAK
ncbi:PepSY domain-containing protein [uncultured Zoogloea sp.]|uniref:PepSY domain-containing protein n=1 Tax=uncultured Zoogloea sp. TaxID=160237 RepID=UPI00261C5303|nr:PepSY domain-containing protein [uncultured Zoogloea sp.]